ncbi:MAG TPA: pitrilysin family protein [Longimicrobiales bacterium]|nr:pitrilysin family protein [Longimicrobiales bacterium]
MPRPVRYPALIGLIALTATSVRAQQPAAGAIPFEAYHLDNGLHVILAPDPEATAVAVNIWYNVGSRHERPGRTGFAHLFEHLMFQGSENIPAGEHSRLIALAGGTSNASVTEDRTNYYQTVPPERMNLALWLEADRMRSLRITEDRMRREIEVVKEERRLRFDNSPYGTTQLTAYYEGPYSAAGCFPYAHSLIGTMDDLDAAELADVQEFFDLYYAPNNATLVVAGAFDAEVARELIDSYFGSIPRGDDPPGVTCENPFAQLPRDTTIYDTNAVLPAVFVSYGGVAIGHPDSPALEVLARVLGIGQSSRLYQQLVRGSQVAVQAGAGASSRLDPGLFVVYAVANQGVEAPELLAALDAEIERVIRDGVAPEEVERARNQVRAQVIMGRQNVMGRAEALQSANHFYGSPDAVATAVDRIASVTPADVQRVAVTYLRPDNRVVIRTQPGPAPQEGNAP